MGPDRKGLSRDYMVKAVEDSLKRLRTDTIDLYQSHTDDNQTPLEETLATYEQLIRQGKVRVIGASNYTARRLAEALDVSEQQGYPRYESLQPLYNLYERADFEKELQPLCQERHLGVLTYFSLASGFLAGKYRTEDDLADRARAGMVKKYLDQRGNRILAALDQVAQQEALTPATVALAWLISRPAVTAPIASATNLEQLDELVRAATVTLSVESIQRLDRASAYDS
jgi:aryl-alcohol dehydrogenase-like predicted oxidoreductase